MTDAMTDDPTETARQRTQLFGVGLRLMGVTTKNETDQLRRSRMGTTTRTRFWRTAPGIAALAALALTACAPEDDSAEFEDAEPASAGEQTAEAAEAQEEAAEEDSADGDAQDDQADAGNEDDEASVDEQNSDAYEVDLGEPVETMTVPMVEDQGEVAIGLHSLVHEGEAMVLTVSFTPDLESEEDIRLSEMFNLRPGHENSLRPYLNDRENLKRYSVLGHGHGDRGWQSSGFDSIFVDGEPGYYWAHFPAPEDDIDAVNVSVLPDVPDFEDVEIQQSSAVPDEAADEDSESGDEDAEDGE